MLTLPPVAPVVETVTAVRLGRDYYVRVAGNDYSVAPTAIGQLVEVRTTLAEVPSSAQVVGWPVISGAGRLVKP